MNANFFLRNITFFILLMGVHSYSEWIYNGADKPLTFRIVTESGCRSYNPITLQPREIWYFKAECRWNAELKFNESTENSYWKDKGISSENSATITKNVGVTWGAQAYRPSGTFSRSPEGLTLTLSGRSDFPPSGAIAKLDWDNNWIYNATSKPLSFRIVTSGSGCHSYSPITLQPNEVWIFTESCGWHIDLSWDYDDLATGRWVGNDYWKDRADGEILPGWGAQWWPQTGQVKFIEPNGRLNAQPLQKGRDSLPTNAIWKFSP
jgi:hypothetical protein